MSGRHVELRSGQRMPLLGLGCSQITGDEVSTAVEAALEAGYRHLDTAYVYQNEGNVGEGLHRWLARTGNQRKDVFIVTKMPTIGMHVGGVEKFLKKSLAELQLDYVDLYLVHFPFGLKVSQLQV